MHSIETASLDALLGHPHGILADATFTISTNHASVRFGSRGSMPRGVP